MIPAPPAGVAGRRVLILTSIVAPYRPPSFAALARQPGIDLLVGFLSEGDRRRPWKDPGASLDFGHVVYDGDGGRTTGVIRSLRSFRPDVVVVGGWDQPAYLVPVAARGLGAFRLVIWSESTLRDARASRAWRERVKRAVVRRADGILVPGSAAAEYARFLGARRVFVAPNAADADLFAGAGANDSAGAADGEPIVLYAGRLAVEKGLDVLLHAWRTVQDRTDAQLVLVGSGPEEPHLRAQAGRLGLRGVRWVPFVQPVELAAWYRLAGLAVLPSRSEPWGFVINEAMAAGLPVVATNAAGAARDLIVDGVNGWRVGVGDPGALAGRIVELASDAELRRRMGEAAQSSVSSSTPEGWAGSVAAMVAELLA